MTCDVRRVVKGRLCGTTAIKAFSAKDPKIISFVFHQNMGCYHGIPQDIFQRNLPCPISRREFPAVRPISLFENGGNLKE